MATPSPDRPRWRPRVVSDGITQGAEYAIVFLFVLSLVLAALNLLWTNRQVHIIQGFNASSCKFFADLGAAPVVSAGGHKPSLLAVTIVADSRQAWRGRNCPGVLPPPSASFTHWAAYYHLEAK